MLNASASDGESVHVFTNYLEEYLDLVESLPLDLQRCVSLMRETDGRYQEILTELNDAHEDHGRAGSDPARRRRLLRSLVQTQELQDERLHVAARMVELVESRTRRLERRAGLLTACHASPESPASPPSPGPGGKRPRRLRDEHTPRERRARSASASSSTSKRRKKAWRSGPGPQEAPPELPEDPGEPTYCLCKQVSYGEMICCDNGRCPVEWFHFSCVGLSHEPKGRWYCPGCRGHSQKTLGKSLEGSKKERSHTR